jgi:hypothetical protein
VSSEAAASPQPADAYDFDVESRGRWQEIFAARIAADALRARD